MLDNMAVLEGVAQQLQHRADAHVAQLTARQAERERELVKVAAKAQKDAKLLMERTNAQLEVMRLATQTIVRYASRVRALLSAARAAPSNLKQLPLRSHCNGTTA